MISSSILIKVAVMSGGMLLASIFAGLGMYRAHELYQKGIKLNKKVYVWLAFVLFSFMLIAIAAGFGGLR